MLWAIKRKSNFDNIPLSSRERDELVEYLGRIAARKYALAPTCDWPEVMFSADPIKVSSGALKYRIPTGFDVFAMDASYMPLAWDGVEAEWNESIEWFMALPEEHKSI